MTRQEGTATEGSPAFPHVTEVVELSLLLPVGQFTALEVVAARSQLTVATLLRRTIGEFLRPPMVLRVRQPGVPDVRVSPGESDDSHN